jgi:hypothetical protein
MTGLQEAFYIVGLVFMGVMLILIIALLAAVFVIRAKINRIHDNIEAKLNAVTNIAEKGGALAGVAVKTATRAAKRAVGKKK